MKVYQNTDENTCIYDQKVICLHVLSKNIKDGLDMGRYDCVSLSDLHVEFTHFQYQKCHAREMLKTVLCLELRTDNADCDVTPAETNAIEMPPQNTWEANFLIYRLFFLQESFFLKQPH